CVRPAASVHSEPGSNSSLKYCGQVRRPSQCFECRARSRHRITSLARSCELAVELTCCSVTNVCKWTTVHPPDARTSHLRTLSRIREKGLSACPRRPGLFARASRTLYGFRGEGQHPCTPFFLPPLASGQVRAPWRGAHCARTATAWEGGLLNRPGSGSGYRH